MKPVCPEHNQEANVKVGLRYKKGAQAGRPIPPFFACPWTGTDDYGVRTYCNHRFEERPTQDDIMGAGTAAAVQKVGDKDSQIRWMNSINNACLLIANGKIRVDGDLGTEDIRSFAEGLYRMEIPK